MKLNRFSRIVTAALFIQLWMPLAEGGKVPPYSSDVLIFPGPFFDGKVTDLSRVTAEFHHPVVGVKAQDLKVNGSPATTVVHEDSPGKEYDKYVFGGFIPSSPGAIEIILGPGEIKDAAT